jgi:hypothetical protein
LAAETSADLHNPGGIAGMNIQYPGLKAVNKPSVIPFIETSQADEVRLSSQPVLDQADCFLFKNFTFRAIAGLCPSILFSRFFKIGNMAETNDFVMVLSGNLFAGAAWPLVKTR